jgi:2-oxoisovalerate dehydrogenase E1 component alpha subunit
LIEAMTYRLSGHSTSDDPKAYRPDGTLEPWRAQDPIVRLRKHLTVTMGWTDAQDKELETEVDTELRAAIKVAEATALPALETMFTDVFAEMPWHLTEQRDQLLAGTRAKKH